VGGCVNRFLETINRISPLSNDMLVPHLISTLNAKFLVEAVETSVNNIHLLKGNK
jgi:hypothetical protein